MNTLTLGLISFALLALGFAAPHFHAAGLASESLVELTNSVFESTDFFPAAAQFDSVSNSPDVTYNGITVNSTLVAQIISALQNVTVVGGVSGGNLSLFVRETTAAVGGHNASVAVAALNATLLTGGANSTIQVFSQNATVYAGAANSTVNQVSVNSIVYEAVVNSSANLVVINSVVLLAASGSKVDVTAVNSSLVIANQSSTVTVRSYKGSTVTYVSNGVGDDYADESNGVAVANVQSIKSQLMPGNAFVKSCQATERVERFWSVLGRLSGEKVRREFENFA
ncbi:hypothetical protein Ddc_18452 [Ditylenchus destructor]|nr:hypothetical protein Ddc_18452 [Ditylenchus destructor]